jgi:hypothetical protein
MTSKLHELVARMSETDLALLVKVAFEGMNDSDAMKEIADLVNMKPDAIFSFAQHVVEPLVTTAEITLLWHAHLHKLATEENSTRYLQAFSGKADIKHEPLEPPAAPLDSVF